MAASFEIGGIRVDYGSHRLSPALPPAVRDDLRSLLGTELQTRRRNGRLLVRDRWVSYPLRAAEVTRALPPQKLARAAFDMVAAPLRHAEADTYADLMRTGLGPTMYEMVYEPYARKIWGLTGDQIDGDQARQRDGADRTSWKVLSAMFRGAPTSAENIYLYPRRGFGQIVEALADAAYAAGADIRLRSEADLLEIHAEHVDVRMPTGVPISARHVFSTIPLPVLARITRPGAPYEAVNASGNLRFRAMVLVYAVHDGGRWSPYDVHYVPESRTPIARVSEPANHRISPDDPANRSVVCFEIPCEVGDRVWNLDDEDFQAMILDAVERTRLPPLRLAWLQVKRLRHVYPVYECGYRASLSELDRWAGTLPNITTFGRLGLFAQDNTHQALGMAYEAVDALGAGEFDHEAWSHSRARFSRHVFGS